MSRPYEKGLDEADRLIQSGQTEQAKTLLLGMLDQYAGQKGFCEDAAALFLLAPMYDEAIQVFTRYKETTGKDLRSSDGSTLADIEKLAREQPQAAPVPGSGSGIDFAAGWWAKLLGEVSHIAIFADRIEVTYKSQVYTYAWTQLTATIATVYYSSPRGMSGYIHYVVLKAPDRSFRLRVSSLLGAQFGGAVGIKLLDQLRRRLPLQQVRPSFWLRLKNADGPLFRVLFTLCVFLLGGAIYLAVEVIETL